jgi:hypothetical protein
MNLAFALTGWLGATCLLLAYTLVSLGRLVATGGLFQWLNVAGSLGLTANSAWHGAWPSATLNLVWIVIGLGTLLRARRGPGAE